MGKFFKGVVKFSVAAAAVGGLCYAFKDKIRESKVYQDNNVEIDENKRKTIENDVDVISYIYRMRGNSPASNLKNCNALQKKFLINLDN